MTREDANMQERMLKFLRNIGLVKMTTAQFMSKVMDIHADRINNELMNMMIYGVIDNDREPKYQGIGRQIREAQKKEKGSKD